MHHHAWLNLTNFDDFHFYNGTHRAIFDSTMKRGHLTQRTMEAPLSEQVDFFNSVCICPIYFGQDPLTVWGSALETAAYELVPTCYGRMKLLPTKIFVVLTGLREKIVGNPLVSTADIASAK